MNSNMTGPVLVLAASLIALTQSGFALASPPGGGSSPTCTGQNSCVTGTNLCTFSNPTTIFGSLTFDDSLQVKSDGLGPYVNATSNVLHANVDGGGHMSFAVLSKSMKRPRSISVDLSQPVPGDIGVNYGVISDNSNLEVNAHWYMDSNKVLHSLLDIPVGQTVYSDMFTVAFHINGVYHSMQVGPLPAASCYSNVPALYGDGTSQATVTRLSDTQWQINLPAGSIGRLFDVSHTYKNAVNKGLYYFSGSYTIGN